MVLEVGFTEYMSVTYNVSDSEESSGGAPPAAPQTLNQASRGPGNMASEMLSSLSVVKEVHAHYM